MLMRRCRYLFAVIPMVIIIFVCIAFQAVNVSAAEDDFEITNGVLDRYTGNDGEVIIPDTVTEIGGYAFNGIKLTQVTIPDSVTIIDANAFFYCVNLKDIVIPDSVLNLGFSAFNGCSSLEEITLSTNITTIEDSTFTDCGALKHIIIPDGVTAIGSHVFNGCTSLESIDLPDTLKAIGGSTFYNCPALKEVIIPEGITNLGTYLFAYDSTLKKVTLPESLTSIDENVFALCEALETVNIPAKLTSIGASAFSNCLSLKSIVLPDSVTSIGYSAFDSCNALTEFNLPKAIKEIPAAMLSACRNLVKVNIPDGVTSVGAQAFFYCEKLSDIKIPASIKEIGSGAFENTAWLNNLSSDYKQVNHILLKFSGYNSNNAVVPEGITRISGGAFSYSRLHSIILPKSVKAIDAGAFDSITEVDFISIPSSVTTIGTMNFMGSDIIIYGEKGSAAENFASNNGLQWKKIGSIKLDQSAASLYSGGKTLTLKLSGAAGSVVWGTDNESIAAVSQSGEVTPRYKGTATIYAIADGTIACCTVKVSDPSISKTKLTLKVGKTGTLALKGISSGITWKSSNKAIATVDKNGKITAKKAGKVVITATFNYVEYKCTVTVQR